MKILGARRIVPRPRDMDAWVDAFAVAAEELAPDTLGFEMAGVTSYRPDPAPGSSGVLMPLNGEAEAVQCGLFAAPAALRILAAAQLGRPDQDGLTEAEVVDGVMDLLEILVGAIEARLLLREASSRGVPFYLQADGMRSGPSDDRAGLQMQVGPVEVTLLIIRRLN